VAPESGDTQQPSIDQAGNSTDSNFGYLPPEPTGITRVKQVIPLPAKKR
jgi:magnesium chelatase subunit I